MDKRYNITVGKKGTFEPMKNVNTVPGDIDDLIANIAAQQALKIALFFHGGLVNEPTGIKVADAMNKEILTTDAYPVSFIWKVGFGEVIGERIGAIHKTKLFKKLLKFVIKKAGSKLNLSLDAKGFGELSDDEIAMELEKEIPFQYFLEDEAGKGEVIAAIEDEHTFVQTLEFELEEDVEWDDEFKEVIQDIDLERDLVDKKAVEVREDDGSKGFFSLFKIIKFIAKIAFKVIKRWLKKRHHGFYPTVIEEILRELYIANFGAWVWGGMKLKAEEMWYSNEGLSGDSRHTGTYFLEKLNRMAENKELSIDLIGHSAGSIVICHLLKAIQHFPNLKIRNILFLAPACRSDLFYRAITTQPDHFKKFRMFTMTDDAESKDALVNRFPKLYPRSLLYFISGVLEDKGKSYDEPILGMERYFAWSLYYKNNQKLNAVRNFLLAAENRVVLSPTSGNPPGLNSNSKDHGAFDDEPLTLDSIKHILKQNGG